MTQQHSVPYNLLELAIGLSIEILSNDYNELLSSSGEALSHHNVVFQIEEDSPDILSIAVLFALSLMSFTYASPRGHSETDFIPDEQWNLAYFIEGLGFEDGKLSFSSDYVSGRMMKTEIIYEPGGKVTLQTSNRGRSAERWLTHLKGKRHIQAVK
jgi:hypothetical protein